MGFITRDSFLRGAGRGGVKRERERERELGNERSQNV
jgi:hypothetical protein